MKKFKFKYANILKLRLDYEEEIKTKLKKLNQELQQLELSKVEIEESYRVYKIEIALDMKKGLKGYEIQQINHFQSYFRKRIESYEIEIIQMEKIIETVKLELMEAIKERKIMEKIKEVDFKAYLDAINVMEGKETDEVVNFQNSKRSGG